jgi:hypothetical protein
MANMRLAMNHISDSDLASANNVQVVHGNTFFVNDDIRSARTFDPFTHVYMFDIGFPPKLHRQLAEMFNMSLYAEWLISYQPPRKIIKACGFKVSLESQFSTSMHGKLLILIFWHFCY